MVRRLACAVIAAAVAGGATCDYEGGLGGVPESRLTVELPGSANETDGVLAGAGRVSLPSDADAIVTVTLTSSDPADLTVPATVDIPVGQGSATFDITIVDDADLDPGQEVMVTAASAKWKAGSASIAILDDDAVITLSVPASATEGDGVLSGQGQVTIPAPLGGDLVVGLTSDDESELTVPTEVTVTAGATSATFDVAIVEDSDVDGNENVTVTASAAGWTDDSETVVVGDNETLAAPTLASPLDGATGVSTDVELTWNAVTGAEGYIIYVWVADGSATNLQYYGITTGTDTTWKPSDDSQPLFDRGETYYWQVMAFTDEATFDGWNAVGTPPSFTFTGISSAYSGVWTFTTTVSPEMDLSQGGTPIATGGSYSFADTGIGLTTTVTFTISNTGTGDLSLTGGTLVEITGTGEISVSADPSAVVVPGGSTTFDIDFSPTTTGAHSATVTIANDDSDESPYTFDISGNCLAPEIDVRQGATDLPSGSGSHSFGDVRANTITAATFTIQNTGGYVLTLTGTPNRVAISGPGAAAYSVPTQPPATVAPSGFQNFGIRFSPTAVASYTATVTIENDDADEGTYTFTVTGNGVVPEMDLFQAGTPITTGDSYSLADTVIGSTTTVTFTIQNTGTGALNLTGGALVQIAGTGDFSVSADPSTPVAAGGSTTFDIDLSPTTGGSHSATVTIANDDPDENPYTFDISGHCLAPEINLDGPDGNIASGTGSYTFSSTRVGNSATAVFTIENLGDHTLTLGANAVSIGGTDASQFSVTAQPATTVAGPGSTTFTLRFAPDSAGSKTATVSIANDDADESPYTFTIVGTGVTPEIDVIDDVGTSIPSGGSYSFGSARVGLSISVTFTVDNGGTATLNLDGSPPVALTGSGDFSVATDPSNTIAAGGSTTFAISFSPTLPAGFKTATVTIENDDLDEDPYTFTISGTGVTPEMNVKEGTVNIADGGSYAFADTASGSSVTVVFTIENTGSDTLSLTGSPPVVVSGTHAALFTVSKEPPASFPPSTSGQFEITFAPTSVGTKTATISIANDDLNENPYDFDVSAVAYRVENVQTISDPDGSANYGVGTSIAVDDSGYIRVCYRDSTFSQIKLATSTNGGATWPAPVAIGPGSGYPCMAKEYGNNRMHIAYANGWHAYCASSNIGISSWTPRQVAANASPTYPAVAAYQNGVEVVYDRYVAAGPFPLAEVRSTNGGTTWQAAQDIDTTVNARYPAVCFVDVNTRYACYVDAGTSLKFIRSFNAGKDWQDATVIRTGNCAFADMAYADSILYCSYTLTGLRCARSDTGGTDWSPGNVIVSDASWTSVDAATGIIVIAFYDYVSDDLKLARSADKGDTWNIISVDTTGDVGNYCDVVLYNGDAHISYYDGTNSRLKYAKVNY